MINEIAQQHAAALIRPGRSTGDTLQVGRIQIPESATPHNLVLFLVDANGASASFS